MEKKKEKEEKKEFFFFSVNYKSSKLSQADEIRCPYNQLNRIKNFFADRRIVIEAPDQGTEEDVKKLISQISYLKDYAIVTGKIQLAKSLIKDSYPTFLRFPVTDWETFQDFVQLGVSDIYIDGPLGFQLPKLKKEKNKIKIRISPTISSAITRLPNTFFIRPEDLPIYSPFVDVIDFREPNQDKEDVLFDIYKRQSFTFDIDQLIKGLPKGIRNPLIRSDFAEKRLNCGQRCMEPDKNCKYCGNQFNFTKTITNFPKKEKEKEK